MKSNQILISLSLLAFCTRFAHAGTTEPPKPSSDSERGLEAAEEVIKEFGLVDDEKWSDRINRIGYRVATRIETRRMPFVFNTVQMKEANAFSLPGGYIFITEGMKQIEFSDDELAHLLGHEMVHANERHYARMAKKNALWSLLHQALLAGILIGMKDQRSTYHGPALDLPSQGDEGKAALFEGTLIFGEVFRDLVQRGYTRDIEIEADELGCKYACAAGYDPAGGLALMEKLHTRFYEAPGMHYWRTHPYFNERVAAAKLRVRPSSKYEESQTERDNRAKLQQELMKLAEKQKLPIRQDLLYTAAVQVDPTSEIAIGANYGLAIRHYEEEEKKVTFVRKYGELIKLFDASIAHISSVKPDDPRLHTLENRRQQLAKEKDDLYPQYARTLDMGAADISTLERFVTSYPDSPRLPEVLYLLGESRRLQKDQEKAVKNLLDVVSKGQQDQTQLQWAEKAEKSMATMLSTMDDLSACYSILLQYPNLKEQAQGRMDAVASSYENCSNGKKFLSAYNDSPYAEKVRARLNGLGEQAYVRGRQLEAIQQFQKAMDAYNLILDNVPSDEILEKTYARIDYIQQQQTTADETF